MNSSPVERILSSSPYVRPTTCVPSPRRKPIYAATVFAPLRWKPPRGCCSARFRRGACCQLEYRGLRYRSMQDLIQEIKDAFADVPYPGHSNIGTDELIVAFRGLH